jgi:hypothetical protein
MALKDKRSELDTSINPASGQQRDYLVLPDEELKKGLTPPTVWDRIADEDLPPKRIRPVRTRYIHTKCGTVTTMGQKIAETYSVNPRFYSGTFCCGCGAHFPVGEDGEFIWDDGSGQKVGT